MEVWGDTVYVVGLPSDVTEERWIFVFRDPRPHLLQFQRLVAVFSLAFCPWAGERPASPFRCVRMGLRFSQVYCRALQVERAWCCHSALLRRFA